MLFHKHKIWFIGIPKTGSTSIWHTLHGLTLKPKQEERHNHHSYKETITSEDPDLTSSYFNVTVIRNPYDRWVSSANEHIRADSDDDETDVNELLAKYAHFDSERLHEVNEAFTPQYKYIVDDYDKVAVPNIWRYENLNEEYEKFAFIYNIHSPHKIPTRLEKINVSTNRKPWKKELNSESIKTINKLYSEDFELLGYDKITTN